MSWISHWNSDTIREIERENFQVVKFIVSILTVLDLWDINQRIMSGTSCDTIPNI